MNLKDARLKILSFDTAVRVDRRAFKKAIVSICKAVPGNQKIRLIIKKGATDMILLASQKICYHPEECGVFAPRRTRRPREENYWELASDPSEDKTKEPAFWIYTIISGIENAEPMDLLVDGKVIHSWLKEIICNGKEMVHIKRNENGLNFCFGDGSDAVRKNIDFTDIRKDEQRKEKREDDLEYLSRVEYVDEIQIDDFSYYFKQTMHSYETNDSIFNLSIDAEKHILVTANGISYRGFVTGDIKHTFYFHKREAKKIAALFLDMAVTIRIPKYNDFLQLTDGNFTVFMPLPRGWGMMETYISSAKALAQEKILTIIAPREKLIKECQLMAPSSPYIRFTISGQILKISEYDITTIAPTELSIEKSPRDKNISCGIIGERLCVALCSITSPSISITFTPRFMMITDYYMGSRRLPQSLRALEIVGMVSDSFHIL